MLAKGVEVRPPIRLRQFLSVQFRQFQTVALLDVEDRVGAGHREPAEALLAGLRVRRRLSNAIGL